MKVLRSSFVAAVAIFAAACGDKVNIVQPDTNTTVTSGVTAVAVAPGTATMSIGNTVSFTAAVTATGTAATTVTWSSSDASKVSVSATGVATAVAATPGVAICATSTVNTGAKGCASVVVSSAPQTIPATVSIASITVAGNLNNPVNPLNTVGQIDVRANVSPGTETVDRVVVLVGTTRADSQTFTAAAAAALRYAADQAIAEQSAFPPILFSINTAKFSPTTGVPTWTNGNYNISVVLYVKGNTAARATATYQTPLTFANANTFIGTATLSGTTPANNAAGFRYNRGDIAVSVLPVVYTPGITVASASITFGNAAGTTCQSAGSAGVQAGQRAKALTAPASGSFAWTATLSSTGTASAANVVGYEFDQTVGTCAAGTINAGESVAVAAAQDNVGNPLITAPVTLGTGMRVDNFAPAAPALVANPNGRNSNWINDAVVFNAVTTGATSNNWIAAAITDAGVGGVTYGVRVGSTIGTAKTAATLTSAASLDRSATNTTYCAAAYSFDAVGNASADPGACNTTFGVDRDNPVVGYAAGGIADLSRYAAAPGIEFIITAVDNGLVGNSGMSATTPAKGTVIFRGNGNTSAQACFMGTIVSSVCTANAMTAAAPNYSSVGMTATPGNTVATEGYYTFTGTAYDAAGNSASVTSRITLVDATAPTVGAATGPLSVASGYTFPVSALVNENLDIQNYFFSAGYAGAPAPFAPAVLPQGTVSAVNGYNATTFINTNYAASSTFNLPVAIQTTAPSLVLTPVNTITLSAANQANTITAGATMAPIPTFGTAATAISTTNFTAFTAAALPAGKTGISSGLSTAATTAKPASSTLSVTTTGTTAIFNNPFARVDFYGLNVAGTAWVFLGSTTASTLTDDAVTRTFTYSIPVTGSTVFTALGGTAATINQNVIAFGFKTDGSVAMVNAAALVLNVVY